MEFRKIVDTSVSGLEIDYQSKLILFGSCFAENIGKRLQESKFRINSNPFGVLYNPASIAESINLLLDNKSFTSADIIQHEGAFHSLYYHSSFSELDQNTFLQNINRKREQASANLMDADVLLVTFGTAYVYRHKQRNHIVANCHKLPANDFEHYRLSVDEIVSIWSKLIDRSVLIGNGLKFLFTVSPIRHWKDGAHNNQLSKATLLLAIEQLAKLYPNVFYFPSFEILMDELRDYRFYADDMIHPSEVAVEYIWKQFSESLFNENTRQTMKQWLGIRRALLHRPLVDVKNEQYRLFLRQTLLKLDVFSKKYPYFDCENEFAILEQKLAQTAN